MDLYLVPVLQLAVGRNGWRAGHARGCEGLVAVVIDAGRLHRRRRGGRRRGSGRLGQGRRRVSLLTLLAGPDYGRHGCLYCRRYDPVASAAVRAGPVASAAVRAGPVASAAVRAGPVASAHLGAGLGIARIWHVAVHAAPPPAADLTLPMFDGALLPAAACAAAAALPTRPSQARPAPPPRGRMCPTLK